MSASEGSEFIKHLLCVRSWTVVLEEMQWKVCLGLCEMTKMVERWAKINPLKHGATLQQGPTVTGSWERREHLKDEGVKMPRQTHRALRARNGWRSM